MDDMKEKDKVLTEERILAAAVEEFTLKGYTATRMQSIADRAKISKSALHYYYRNKERLFKLVLDKTAGKILNQLHIDLTELGSFEEKLEYGFRYYYQAIHKNIKIIRFVHMELNRNPSLFREFLKKRNIQNWLSALDIDLNKEYKAGRIRQISAEQLILNIVSLSIFPHLSRNIVGEVMNLNQQSYQQMLQDRENSIMQFIRHALFIKE